MVVNNADIYMVIPSRVRNCPPIIKVGTTCMKITLLAFLLTVTDIVKGRDLSCYSNYLLESLIILSILSRTGRNLFLRGGSSLWGRRSASTDLQLIFSIAYMEIHCHFWKWSSYDLRDSYSITWSHWSLNSQEQLTVNSTIIFTFSRLSTERDLLEW